MKYVFSFILYFLPSIFLLGQSLETSVLPIIEIYTEGKEIIDEPKVLVQCGIINQASGINNINDDYTDFDGLIGIEIRGQSSSFFDKKSYGIEFKDDLGEDMDVSVLGFPEEEDFVLHGPYSDKSLIRNAIAYTLASDIMEYAPRSKFVELVIDDNYKGIYLMVEKIKRDKNRVDIAKLNPIDIAGEEVEGGYILRFDKIDSQSEILWESPFIAEPGNGNRVPFVAAYPDPEDLQFEQRQYIKNYVTAFEDALDSPTFEFEGVNYKEYIDISTVIDYMLINEFLRNVDGYRISTYFFKDKGGKLKIGPVWDYNLAMGNADYCEGGEPNGWQYNFNFLCPWDGWVNHFWWRRFLEDEEFLTQFQERYEELREGVFSRESIHARIDSLVDVLGDESVNRNFQKYPIMGSYVWPNRFVGSTYEEEINYLKGWFDERITFIDTNISEGFVGTKPTGDIEVYPNPNSGDFTIFFGEFYLRSRLIHLYNAQGELIMEKEVSSELELNISLDLLPGVYFLRTMNYEGKTINNIRKILIF